MKAIGTLSHKSRSGNLLVRGKGPGETSIPSIYSDAAIGSTRIGKIRDVIGPSSRPYIVIKPDSPLSEKELSRLSTQTIYEVRSKHAKARRSATGKKSRVH